MSPNTSSLGHFIVPEQSVLRSSNREHTQEPDKQIDNNKVLISSYLLKRTIKTHQWKKKWVVLRNCQLSYYKDSTEHKASKVFNEDSLLSFSTIPDNNKYHFAVYTNNRVLHFKVSDGDLYTEWTTILGRYFRDKCNRDNEAVRNQIMQHTKEKQPQFLPNSATEIDYSGDDQYLSSGVSDSPLTPRIHGTLTFLPLPSLATHPNEEDEDNENLSEITHLSISGDAQDKEYIIEQGYLMRLRKRYNQWKKFYIILSNQNMYFYKNQEDLRNSNIYKLLPVNDIIDVIELDPLSKSKIWCLLIITPLKRLRFCASSETEMIKWLSALKILTKKRET